MADLLARRQAELEGSGNTPAVADVTRPAGVKLPPPSDTHGPARLFRWLRFFSGHWVLAAGVLAMLVGSLGLTEAIGVTDVQRTVIRLFSPEDTLVIVVDDPAKSVKEVAWRTLPIDDLAAPTGRR